VRIKDRSTAKSGFLDDLCREKQMRKVLPMVVGIVAALLAATAIGQIAHSADSASTTSPAPQIKSAEELEQQWTALLEKLGSGNFQERESAQKELNKATRRDFPTLQALAEKQTAVEIKQRLLKRVDELLVQMAFEPPPIDFDVQDGSLPDVCDALTKATGVVWKPLNWGRRGTFTLHAKQKPFLDVFLALNAQHPLDVQPNNGLAISDRGILWGNIYGGVLIYPVSLSRTTELQQDPDTGVKYMPTAITDRKAPDLVFSYGVFRDPRLKIQSWVEPQITSVVDEKGHIVYHSQADRDNAVQPDTMVDTHWGEYLPIAAGQARTITISGQMKVSVTISEVTVEVPDIQKQGKTPIEVADQEILWDKFELKNGDIHFQLSLRDKVPTTTGLPSMKPVRITLMDAKGRRLISQTIQRGWGDSIPGSDALPIKAILTVSSRTEEQTLPFAFKDMPAP
jgi:hypothetical protein